MATNESELRELLHRYQQGECTPAEYQRVEEWYRRLGAGQPLELTQAERAALVDATWQRIADQTTARPQAAPRGLPWASIRRAAAVLLALGTGAAGLYFGLSPIKADKSQPTAAATSPTWKVYDNVSSAEVKIALPDGSAVRLAPASQLKYPRAFAGARRDVYLTGAAFFDVSHDARHPFLVYTPQVVTTVLGTSFRVVAYAGQTEAQVQVRTGKVRVQPRTTASGPGAASLLVLPNQQAVYSAARHQLRRELVAKPVQLAPQSFAFNDRPVAEVLEALAKAYGVGIEFDANALRYCTLNLSLTSEPLFEKLDIICEILGATYEKSDGRILFHGQPCPAE